MNKATALALIMAAALAALLWLQQRAARRDDLGAELAASPLDAPYDYYVSGLRSERFGRDGTLDSRLEADRVTHFPAGDRAEMEAPRYTAIRRDGSVWQVAANTGTLAPDVERGEDRFDLAGTVELRKPLGSSGTMQLSTSALAVFTDSEEALSDAPVSLRTPDTALDGVGLQALLAEERIKILHEVRGSHVPNANDSAKAALP